MFCDKKLNSLEGLTMHQQLNHEESVCSVISVTTLAR